MPSTAPNAPAEPDGRVHYPPISDRVIETELYLTSIGSLHYPPGAPYPSRDHPKEYWFSWRAGRRLNDYALVRVDAGRGEKELSRGRQAPFASGETILVCPGEWHRYRPDPATGWTERWLCLNGEHVFRLRRKGWIPEGNASLGVHAAPGWRERFDRILDEAVAEGSGAHLGAAGLAVLLQACAKRAADAPEAPADGVGRAMRLIRENCHRRLQVADLAAALEVSPRTLERRFLRERGRGPREEIIRVRLERAKRLLARRDMPIKAIAYTCGFGSPKLMNRNFRRFLGATPGAFRRRN